MSLYWDLVHPYLGSALAIHKIEIGLSRDALLNELDLSAGKVT